MPDTPQSPDRLIPARSRRQAMDWSLVLSSQGIEHIIEHKEETGWALAVLEANHQAALDAIRQYRVENMGWRWRRQVFDPGVVFDWSSAAWVLLNCVFYAWSGAREDLRSLGMVDGSALAQGELWRLFTATWLHADPVHLAMNAVFGLVFMGLAMGGYGPGVGLLAAYIAGVGGNIASWVMVGESQRSLGSSGVVMGALGLLTVQSFSLLKHRNSNAFRILAGAIVSGLMLFAILGLSPGTDFMAHLGGFVCGMALGTFLAFVPKVAHRPWLNAFAGILFAALVILPWLCVLARGN